MQLFSFIIVFFVFLIGNAGIAQEKQGMKTAVSLNQKNGCSVRMAAWLSPSCTHCAEYFQSDLPKITAMPGFCLDLHFLPHLYLLDMPVSILIWSKGAEKVMEHAGIFLKNQDEWLKKSADAESKSDEERQEDTNEFIQTFNKDQKLQTRIRNYFAKKDPAAPAGKDPYLYLRMFAIKHFGISHTEKFLPKGPLDDALSTALIRDLPAKDGKAITFSPAFTTVSGKLIPDDQLERGILTPDVAEKLLKIAGPIQKPLPQAAPKPQPKKQPAQPKPKNVVKAKKAEVPIPDHDAQYADEDAEEIQYIRRSQSKQQQQTHHKHKKHHAHKPANRHHEGEVEDDFAEEEDDSDEDDDDNHHGIMEGLENILEGMQDLEDDLPDENVTS